MDEQLARAIGARVRAARLVDHRTQAVIAGLAGITADYLYQIERGKKLPTIPVLVQLADVMRVPASALLGEKPTSNNQHPVERIGDGLHRALTQPVPSYEPPVVLDLRRHIESVWRTWQTSPNRYSEVVTQLPTLIADTELAERRHRAGDDQTLRRAVNRCAVDLYGLLRTVTKRVGQLDLSLLVADRAIRAAEAADDPYRLAAARWNLAHVLLAEHEAEGAEVVAMQAADAMRPLAEASDLDATALYGALVLLSSVTSVRQGKVWMARQLVGEAAELASRTGERNVCWTAFGPTNVAMHAMSIEIEAGETAEALRLAEQIDHDRSPSIERRVAFLLEQAKGYEQRQDYASTLLLLQTANREAPEDVAHRPTAHRLLNAVIHRGRRGIATEASRLASLAGLAIG